ncbi:MAG: hypothetical protein Q9174_007219 [Haloplaca sp. 1 TL-2023]
MDSSEPKSQRELPQSETRRFSDLHNTKVEFGSTSRPRSRYLYWMYLCGVLKRSWRTKKSVSTNNDKKQPDPPADPKPCGNTLENVSEKELGGKLLWGIPGPWMKRAMHTAFVEELGPGYEYLMSDVEWPAEAEEEVTGWADLALLTAAEAAERSAGRKLRELGLGSGEDIDTDGEEEEEGGN